MTAPSATATARATATASAENKPRQQRQSLLHRSSSITSTCTASSTSTSTSTNTSTNKTGSSAAAKPKNTKAMERQLREQILHRVDTILLQQPPSRSSLLQLLRLCNPTLDASTLDQAVAREKAFRLLKARLHPDKHHALQSQRVTQLFQNAQQYYVDCCHAMANQKGTSTGAPTNTASPYTSPYTSTTNPRYSPRTDSPNSVVPEPPLEFDVLHKWTHLRQLLSTRDTPFGAVSDSELQYHMAYACLNYRGALVHGQAIDCTYQVPVNYVETARSPRTVPAVWAQAGFPSAACRHWNHATTELIQEEIWKHGPVVSTSFVLDPAYYQSTRHAGNFSERHVNQVHPLVLLGWTISDQGPVWLAHALRGPAFWIGMHQFQIQQDVWAPARDILAAKSWQSPGPFWDIPKLADKSDEWKEHFEPNNNNTNSSRHSHQKLSLLELMPLTSHDMENLADLWTDGVGFHTVISERRSFVLRDADKMAQSRRVILREVSRVQYSPNKRVWKATLSVVRN